MYRQGGQGYPNAYGMDYGYYNNTPGSKLSPQDQAMLNLVNHSLGQKTQQHNTLYRPGGSYLLSICLPDYHTMILSVSTSAVVTV